MTSFTVGLRRGAPANLFQRADSDPFDRPAVWVCEVTAPALILGSAQGAGGGAGIADSELCRSAGVDVVVRRSGGGAVLLTRGTGVWVDVIVPATHGLHDDDVDRSFRWIGESWTAALRRLGFDAAAVATPARRHLGRLICFAGLGYGEVAVGRGPAASKVVGVSQRRTRLGSRFSSLVVLDWDPAAIGALVRVPPELSEEMALALEQSVVGLRSLLPSLSSDAVVDAFVAELPA